VTAFLVELYVSRADAAALGRGAERVRRAADEQTRRGTPVRYLRSIYVPEDETCLLLFDAVSAEAVSEVASRAALPYERLVAAIATEAVP
jgi:hypothetical protein